MLTRLLSLIGCRHARLTRPLTPVRRGIRLPTYVVCTDCGREFGYDWSRMVVVDDHPSRIGGEAGEEA
jgi:hypothetical protein